MTATANLVVDHREELPDGTIATASARLCPLGDACYVSNVIVGWWCRGKGVGLRLMQEVCRVADENGWRLLTNCRDELVPFYGKVGFEPTGERSDFLGVGLRREVAS